ncbi:hypothetical protein DSO57_1023993 [Entomophthora muscae]|uniref:Uncharacterized protein n=1 Tax=Entomophthora muscae TaxID=34485 RepID=A0ACC2TQ52_9FUNG|nr:hypothetical protein DSO57_1023993 [Entomophthora muscae]
MKYFDRFLDSTSHSTQLVVTAVLASALTASSIFAFQALGPKPKRKQVNDKLKVRSLSPLGIEEDHIQKDSFKISENDSEVLIKEQLARNSVFLGEEGMAKLRKAKIIVVGAGGVGSWAAVMLARSGVFNIRVIDFDQVTLSSLNRHASATREDVGIPKVIAIKRHIKKFAPSVQVDARNELFNSLSARSLLEGSPDLVLDCIDNIKTKVELLKYCHDNNIPVVSSMGAGAKADPTRIQISDISETSEDPLARAVRQLLKKSGIPAGIPVVYSSEKPGSVKLLPLEESKAEDATDFAILPEFRSRILPVLGTLPAMFGMTLASYTICEIAGYPLEPLAIKRRTGLYNNILRDLEKHERSAFNSTEKPPFDKDDVAFLVEEVWRSRSAVSGQMDKVKLVRWDISKPLGFSNCILLTSSEVSRHIEAGPAALADLYPKATMDYIKARLELSKQLCVQRELPPI